MNCDTEFGEYYCEICSMYENDMTKKIFHCDKCGICRKGGRENFEHCDACGCCMAKGFKHKCKENTLKQNCPVCLNDLFTSI